MRSSRVRLLGFALLLVSLPAYSADIPLRNWSVPPYTRPAGSSGGLSTMNDISLGVSFVAVTPCRVVDTRPSQGFAGAYGPPIMAANAIRPFDINSAPHCPGIPAGVEAYSLNFTVTETTGQPGDVRAFPTGAGVPNVSTLNWNFVGPAALANGIIVAAAGNGSIDVLIAGFATHLIIDINGYFAPTLNDGNFFQAAGDQAGGGIIYGVNNSGTAGSAGVRGFGFSGTGAVFGVLGEVVSPTTGASGVRGISYANSGATAGVHGTTASTSFGTAGVLGRHGSPAYGTTFSSGNNLSTAGAVWGISGTNTGVIGQGPSRGVTGYNCPNANPSDCGPGGVVGHSATVGLHSFGDITGAAKSFIEPHPTDPSKQIKYVSLEGPEAGTYFRGKARFQNGVAVIAVPDYFRLATDPEGLSIQVTPIGEMATFAVQSIGLDRIVVRGSRNVEFFYVVNGIRPAYRDFVPIVENTDFRPQGEGDTLPDWKQPHIRRMLVANGTLTPDGEVNMETARRLGWDRIWAESARTVPVPAAP